MTQHNTPEPARTDPVPARHPGAGTALSGLAGRAPLWKARHPSDSTREMPGLPVLFWLVAELRPALTVQIGLGDGTGFLGLCQAIEKAETGGVLFVRPFGDEALTPQQAERHGVLYPQIARIGAADGDDLPEDLGNRPLQLLILRQPLGGDLRASWLSRLAEDAVILAHVPATPRGEEQLTALQDALPQKAARVSFRRDGESLELFLMGSGLPGRLLRLAGSSTEAQVTRALLQRLGDGMGHQALAHERQAMLIAATALQEKTEALLADLRGEAAAARQSEASEVAMAAVLQAQVFDLTRAIEQATQERTELSAMLDARTITREELASSFNESESITEEASERGRAPRDKALLREDMAARLFDRLERLSADKAVSAQMLAHERAKLQQVTEEADASRRVAREAEATLSELRKALQQAEAERAAHDKGMARHRDTAEAAQAQVSVLQEDNAALAARVAVLEAEKGDMRMQAAERMARYATALAGMAEDLETARAARSTAEALSDTRQAELHDLTVVAEAAHDLVARQKAEIESLQATQARQADLIARKQAKIEALKAAQAARTRSEAATQARQAGLIARKQAEIEALRASTSWRITAPVRKVKDGLKRLTKG